jgi:hypothetical protein
MSSNMERGLSKFIDLNQSQREWRVQNAGRIGRREVMATANSVYFWPSSLSRIMTRLNRGHRRTTFSPTVGPERMILN